MTVLSTSTASKVTLLITLGILCGSAADTKPEAAFLAENNGAMSKIMADMIMQPTGDVDRDFVGSMVPHHQGAIDMAVAELHYGRNEQLRCIAQEIIVQQQQELAAMRMALGQRLSHSALPSSLTPQQCGQETRFLVQPDWNRKHL